MSNPYESPIAGSVARSQNPRLRARTVGMITTIVVLIVNGVLIAFIPVARSEDADSMNGIAFFAVNVLVWPILWLASVTIGLPDYTPERGLIDYIWFVLIGIVGAVLWGALAACICFVYRSVSRRERTARPVPNVNSRLD